MGIIISTEGSAPVMMSIRKVSELTGLSYYSLRNACIQGEIAHIKSGAKYLINYTRLCDYLNESKGQVMRPEGNNHRKNGPADNDVGARLRC